MHVANLARVPFRASYLPAHYRNDQSAGVWPVQWLWPELTTLVAADEGFPC